MRLLRRAFASLCGGLVVVASVTADEPVLVDLEALNRRIGTDYEAAVTYEEMVQEALSRPLILFGVVHDQECPARQVQRLLLELQNQARGPVCLGVEFIDRGDMDILQAFLEGRLDETQLLERVFPTSLLLSPQVGRAHLEILRFARSHDVQVLPLESRPSGARPRKLRNAEIRWNLAQQLGRHPGQRLVVMYGIDHVLGDDDIAEGLEVPALVVTSYADSVQEVFRLRHGRYPRPGEVLRLRHAVFLDPCEVPRMRRLLSMNLEARENLLMVIESVYFGDRDGIEALLDALVDPDVRWRRAAWQALRFCADVDVDYDPEATMAGLREGQARWRAWWRAAQDPTSAASDLTGP